MQDAWYLLRWEIILFLIGITFLPISFRLFSNFYDKGYLFSKTIGIIFVSYTVFLLSSFKLLPFEFPFILGVFLVFMLVSYIALKPKELFSIVEKKKKIIILEELLFFLALLFWSYIRSHDPKINGLEKFMDFGFINSLMRSSYLPPTDMWFPPFSINYYYFGHFVTALLTKLSLLPSYITYNLMLSTLFAFTLSLSFSIGLNIMNKNEEKLLKKSLICAIFTALLVTFAGNLHTIYAFFKPYNTDDPKPFFDLTFSLFNLADWRNLSFSFPNSYWYPNATRFIPFTIHEFPIYSFVVADLHGHVLDIPFVLTTLASIYALFMSQKIKILLLIFISLLLSVMYMTNAWDGLIYLFLTVVVIIIKSFLINFGRNSRKSEIYHASYIKRKTVLLRTSYYILLVILGFVFLSIPFSINFKPFVSGIGVICPPEFLVKLGRVGPFLFEANHCQRSPFWMLAILYGFFYFFVISFLIYKFALLLSNNDKIKKDKTNDTNNPISDLYILLLILLSTALILTPEFIYAKDIYPQHYRANTMFKLGYQAFIMLSIASSYIFVSVLSNNFKKVKRIFNFYFVFFILSIIFFILVMIYPYFAIQSYYQVPPNISKTCNKPFALSCIVKTTREFVEEDIKNIKGLDGISYLKNQYEGDYKAIMWINNNLNSLQKGKKGVLLATPYSKQTDLDLQNFKTKLPALPVILEAQGDSYTDYGRVSANTGFPTILGWTVHEWLWRGTYDIPAPRIEDVKNIYESSDLTKTTKLLKKYAVSYVYLGELERQKYSNIDQEKFQKLGNLVYQNKTTKIYKIND